jgi:hypothetical protein
MTLVPIATVISISAVLTRVIAAAQADICRYAEDGPWKERDVAPMVIGSAAMSGMSNCSI